jgi:hypothetical protein
MHVTLARFQQRYQMRICGLIYFSNHCHLLLRPRSVKQLAAFMRDVNSKIAREAGRLHGWREKIWSRRYTDIVISHEPETQIARLHYLLEQGCKEGLVASPRHFREEVPPFSQGPERQFRPLAVFVWHLSRHRPCQGSTALP